ncbi:MAG: hypothetical protein OXB99_08205 [Acidimicrobiaceae bacterium]|nr:hypothetical protein [Acidimicrobiaceae bacterium]
MSEATGAEECEVMDRRRCGVAVLYEKPWSTVHCDWVWQRTDLWINFPWSTEPPIVSDEQARA